MKNQFQQFVQKQMHQKSFLSLQLYSECFGQFDKNNMRQLMTMAKEEKWQLICRVLVDKMNQTTIQIQNYENIRKGRLKNSINSEQLQFCQEEIKKIQILAIYSSNLTWQEALNRYKMPQNIKKKKYINELLKKKSSQMEPLTIIEENKKVKAEKVIEKDKIGRQNINQKVKPLAKVTSKQPPLKITKQQANKVQAKSCTEQVITTNRQKKTKMLIESDEEWNKDSFKKMWIKDGKETDTSGKKENDEDKMDVEQPQQFVYTQQAKRQPQKSDDDEDDYLFEKMNKTTVKQTKSSAILTKAKSQSLAPQANIKKTNQASIPKGNSLYNYFSKQ